MRKLNKPNYSQMNVLKKSYSDTSEITKSLDDDEPYTSETKIKDNTRNYDEETKYSSTDDSKCSSTHDFPVDNPRSTKILIGKFKRHDEILKKCRARNFKLSDFATYQSKTDDHEIDQLSNTSPRCICKPIKIRLKNKSKVCNCAPKTCRCTADQSKKNTCQNNKELSKICGTRTTDTSVPGLRKFCNCTCKTDSSTVKTRKVTKKQLKKSRSSKFKTGATDNYASDPSKADGTEKENFATDQSKTDSSNTDTFIKKTRKRTKKLKSKKSRNKLKQKTSNTDNLASNQTKADDAEAENFATDQTKPDDSKTGTSIIKTREATEELSQKSRAYFTPHQLKSISAIAIDDSHDDGLPSLAITPVDIILTTVKYKHYDHPKTIKYKDTCLAGDYGTRILAWGDSLKEAFEQCGMALCSYMLDHTTVEILKKIYIEIEADEVMVLLYRFIEELRRLYITAPYFRCKKLEITAFNTNRNGCFIGCNCFGEEAKKDKHSYSIAIEGTDFVNMKIINEPDNNRFEISCLINTCS